jgi:hypothetical protein
MSPSDEASSDPGQPPAVLENVTKDGSYTISSTSLKPSIKQANKVVFQRTMYKLMYRNTLDSGVSILGFFARGIKSYDNSLLLYAFDKTGRDGIFAFRCGADPTSTPKLLDIDATVSKLAAFQAFVGDVRQVLWTEDVLVLLSTKTRIAGVVDRRASA